MLSWPVGLLAPSTRGEERLMNRSRRLVPPVAILFVFGGIGLSRFSHNVRIVDVVGLSGAGASLGVGFVLLVLGLTGRIKP
jgi:hypothetical protein